MTFPSYSGEEKSLIYDLLGSDPVGDVKQWVQSKLEPEEVFTREQLNDWAIGNGFVRISK